MNTLSSFSSTPVHSELGGVRRALGRFFDAFVASRQAKADKIAMYYLAKLSDGELNEQGYSAAQVEEIRTAGQGPMPYQL
ncbi:MAG: hypothetical protein K0U74_03855 [Alphaproteobacteria bacterium]|nr:hypothetical protein [Alphaproteobacteria bacterium]